MRRDHEASVALVEAPTDLEGELDRAFELEAAGWKGEAGTAIDSTKETALFYRSVASAYHRLGELRLSTIVLDGELAAFDLCLLHGDRLWTLKSSYNESFPRLSPGNVLLLLEIERSLSWASKPWSCSEGSRTTSWISRPASATTFDFAPTGGARPLGSIRVPTLGPAGAPARLQASRRYRPLSSPASARGSDPPHGPARAVSGPRRRRHESRRQVGDACYVAAVLGWCWAAAIAADSGGDETTTVTTRPPRRSRATPTTEPTSTTTTQPTTTTTSPTTTATTTTDTTTTTQNGNGGGGGTGAP